MFHVHPNADGSFDLLWSGQKILSGCRPVVMLHDGLEPVWHNEAYRIEAGDGNDPVETVHRFSYESDGQLVQLQLSVYCTAASVRMHASVQVKNELFGIAKTLSPEGSIRLKTLENHPAEGLMASYIYYKWWMRPAFIKEFSSVPKRTQALLWKHDNTYLYVLAGLSDRFVSSIQGEEGGLSFQASCLQGGCYSGEASLFALAASRDPYQACNWAVKAGIRASGGTVIAREEREYPDMLEYLGWCSWDAFYKEVNAQAILVKAEELLEKNVPVRWFMIDDGWSDTDDAGCLVSFGTDRRKFPEGLGPIARKLKEKYGLAWVGVWQALTGYWNGIQPDSILAREMAPNLLRTAGCRLLPHPEVAKGFRFWHAWHSSLRNDGIDFIKVDSQSSLIEFVKHDMPVGEAARGTHSALEASAGIHFGMRMINCMGMQTESLWSRPRSGVSRNSDDFFPKKEHSFREHALQNAYNSLYNSQLYWGDWDMWWTEHPYAVQNAVLRAVSGGPVYISDPVGMTDPAMLRPLMLKDGRILRCEGQGMPTEDILLRNCAEEPIPLKIWNRSGETGIIGVWNVNGNGMEVKGALSVEDVAGMCGEYFAIYSHFARKVYRVGRSDHIPLCLDDRGCELYVVAPVHRGIAIFGLTDKYISSAAVVYKSEQLDKTSILLKEAGTFGFAAERRPSKVMVNGVERECIEAEGLYSVTIEEAGKPFIEIWR